MTRPDVVVVGSLNLDLAVPVPRHPVPGETVLGGDWVRTPGGKGANQAVAAARLRQRVAMVGRVGDDEPGRILLDALGGDGVDIEHVTAMADAPTGLALIAVDPNGENTIVVSPGANGRLGPGDVEAAGPLLAAARACLLQLEVPLETVAAAAGIARGAVVLNPAPAPSERLPADLLRVTDVLVPNRQELAVLAGAPVPDSLEEVEELARALEGPAAVVITLGGHGALLVRDDVALHVAATAVEAVDTTAAGDAFCGALADGLARGLPLEDAVRWAGRVAGQSTTRAGAQASLPTRAEVEAA